MIRKQETMRGEERTRRREVKRRGARKEEMERQGGGESRGESMPPEATFRGGCAVCAFADLIISRPLLQHNLKD